MIMTAHTLLYNTDILLIIRPLEPSKACPTPVGGAFATCRGPVHIVIHNFLHRFYILSSQGSQQVHVILANSAFRFA